MYLPFEAVEEILFNDPYSFRIMFDYFNEQERLLVQSVKLNSESHWQYFNDSNEQVMFVLPTGAIYELNVAFRSQTMQQGMFQWKQLVLSDLKIRKVLDEDKSDAYYSLDMLEPDMYICSQDRIPY